MGDNLGPFGLSLGCKVIYSRIDPDAFMAWAIIARLALSPSTPRARARPFGLREWTAKARPSNGLSCQECGKARLASEHRRRTGDMGDRLRAEWVIEGLQGLLLQVEISEIVVHEADEPDPLVDFLDAELLARQHG